MNGVLHTVDAILIDLDGVLRFWPATDNLIEERHGLPRGSIRKVALADAILQPCIHGLILDSEWRESIVNELSREYPLADALSAVRIWSEPNGVVNTFALETLARMCSGVKLVLATNATSRLEADLNALGIRELFFSIANSSELGFVKPEHSFYHAALEIAKLQAEHVLYIDDTLENVHAASEIGIRCHHYSSVDGMATFLAEMLMVEL